MAGASVSHATEARRAEGCTSGNGRSVAGFVRRHLAMGDRYGWRSAAGWRFRGDVDQLSVRAVMPAFVKMEREHGSLVAALQKSSRGGTSASVFTTLKSGLQALIDRMAAALPASSIRLQEKVHKIEFKSEKWWISGALKDEFDAVFIASPADVTRGLLLPIDSAFDELLAMDASSAIVVALAFAPEIAKSLRIPRGFGFLVPQSHRADRPNAPQLLACTFVDQKFGHRALEGGVLLRAFFGGASAPLLLDSSDDEIIALAHRQLSALLGPLPSPSFTVVGAGRARCPSTL